MEIPDIVNVVKYALFIASFGFWVGYFYFSWRMIRGRKEGVKAFGREVLWNPFNICLKPSLLTPAGLRARRWFFICFCGFPLCILSVFGLSIMFEP